MSEEAKGLAVAAILLVLAAGAVRELLQILREGVAYSYDDEGRASAVVERASTPRRFRFAVLGQVVLMLFFVALALLVVWLSMSDHVVRLPSEWRLTTGAA